MNATTVAVDLAKNVFELAVADRNWKIIERARFTRSQFERWFDNRECGTVEQEAEAHPVGLGGLAQFGRRRRMARHQVVDQSQLECGFERTRADQVAQKVIDDQEFEFRVEVAPAFIEGGHGFSWMRAFLRRQGYRHPPAGTRLALKLPPS
jgi:hypothetical protein